ncbi:hypothetical protein CCMA1212_007643 [Trichoderma ghanense]|uniref:Uncharacterized protein n=1 Tax=Trichoderma ghanense TaxID=65468 RepID=A0ABY2GX67_9HYPO
MYHTPVIQATRNRTTKDGAEEWWNWNPGRQKRLNLSHLSIGTTNVMSHKRSEWRDENRGGS